MKIAVYGASGYTGGLVLAELARRDIPAVLTGRDPDRLRTAAAGAGMPDAEMAQAGLDDHAALSGAFAGCAAVINCAGPFITFGESVVRAAIAAGCHYVDISGEQLYLQRVFERFGQQAADAGVTVVPGVNDDGLPSSLIAHLAAERVAPVSELVIALDLTRSAAAPSRGTLRSALANLATFRDGGLSFDDGTWHPGVPAQRESVTFPGEPGPVPVVKFPLPGVATIPRHVPTSHVEGVARAVLVEAFSQITLELIDTVPDGPSQESRTATRWTVVAEATGADGRRARGVVSGPDTYGATAIIAVESARQLASQGARPGVLAPAQAFDPAGFLDFLTKYQASWSIEAWPAVDGKVLSSVG
jgi:short subunit dehydrogenase-like uncharacterized protein